jgi:hypothetical protein
MAGVAQRDRRLGQSRTQLEGGDEPVRDPLRHARRFHCVEQRRARGPVVT